MVLNLYGMSGYRLQDIPQFTPERIAIDKEEAAFQHCITDLQLKLRTIGGITGCNEVYVNSREVST